MVLPTAATVLATHAPVLLAIQELATPQTPQTRFLASAIVGLVIGGGVMLWEVLRARREK